MYYIIETRYVGPNLEQHIDSHAVRVTTEPATSNTTGYVVLDGWAGTTNDWAVFAHGEYETAAEAEEAVDELFGPCREVERDCEEAVLVFRVGQHEPLTPAATEEWLDGAIDIGVNTDIDDEVDEIMDDARSRCGYELDRDTVVESVKKAQFDSTWAARIEVDHSEFGPNDDCTPDDKWRIRLPGDIQDIFVRNEDEARRLYKDHTSAPRAK